MRITRYGRTALWLVAIFVVVGCGREQIIREPMRTGQVMPVWYHGIDPEPDGQFMYFTGYHEGGLNFNQARSLAERSARASVARYLGTEVVEKVESLMQQSGTNWADLYAEEGSGVGKTSQGPVSVAAEDWVKESLKTIVAESVNRARIKDLYIEKVTFRRRGAGVRTRFDAGVMIEFPVAEMQRLQSLEALKVSDKQEVNDMVRRAETLWTVGDRDDAVQVMESARRRYPADQGVAMQLAQYYEDMGRNDDALRIYSTVSNQGGTGAATNKATAKVTAMTNAQAANYLKLLERHDIRGQDLVDVLTWARGGDTSRARQMASERYQADQTNNAMLYAWMITSMVDHRLNESRAAQYDAGKAQKLADEAMKKWQGSKEAEPAIAALLGMVQQDVGSDEAIKELSKIERKFPKGKASFSPEIGEMAAVTLGSRNDNKSQDLAEWLNRAE